MKKEGKRKYYLHRVLETKYESIVVTVSLVFLFLAILFTSSYQASRQLQRRNIYGVHNGIITNITSEDYEKIKSHLSVNHTGLIGAQGEIMVKEGDTYLSIGEVGISDENLWSFESFQWIDGRAPQSENEIVVETNILNQLNLSYTCPQTITLWILEEGKEVPVERTYELVGIVRPFSSNWSISSAQIPGALTCGSTDTIFSTSVHCLIDTTHTSQEEMSELKSLFSYKSERLIYNSYSYPEEIDNTYESYAYGSVSYTILILFIFAYLLILLKDQPRIKERVQTLKHMGCTNGTLFKITLRSVLINWFNGFMIAGLITLLVYCVSYFIALHSTSFAVSMTSSSFLLGIAVLPVMSVLHVLFLSLDLRAKEKQPYFRKRKTADKSLTYPSLKRIFTYSQAKHTIMTCALLILSMTAITTCIFTAYSAYYDYEMIRELNAGYSWMSTANGLNLQQLLAVQNAYGIDEVVSYNELTTDMYRAVEITDETDNNESYIDMITGGVSNQNFSSSIISFPKDSSVYNAYIKGKSYENDFNEGKTVILYMPSITESSTDYSLPYEQVNTLENAELENASILNYVLTDNSAITLHYNEGSYTFDQVEVITKLTGKTQQREDIFTLGSIIVCPSLYAKITGIDNETYNTVYAYTNPQTADETTAIQMSNISKTETIEFTDDSSVIENAYYEFLTTAITALGILLFIFVFSLVSLTQAQQNYFEKAKSKILLVRQIGAQQRQIKKLFYKPSAGTISTILILIHVFMLFMLGFYSSKSYYSSDTAVNILSTLQLRYAYFPWMIDILCVGIYLAYVYRRLLFKKEE